MELSARTTADYEFLDAGDGCRLERFGGHIFNRPSPVALWRPERPELWKQAAGVYHRSTTGGGHWTFTRQPPPQWPMKWDDLTFTIKPTGFGHMGLFPEHTCHWDWVTREVKAHGSPCRV
ncbi:MAG: SAM-dependent methyltransferase, partial [bacterium]